jgi:tRNA C32,U32 (ribose-2'-O)-methylase TrmJ
MNTPSVVLIDPKFPHNVGAAIRACSCFGVDSLLWTGNRIDVSKYARLQRVEGMIGYKHLHFLI